MVVSFLLQVCGGLGRSCHGVEINKSIYYQHAIKMAVPSTLQEQEEW
jgi:hypothetical protein